MALFSGKGSALISIEGRFLFPVVKNPHLVQQGDPPWLTSQTKGLQHCFGDLALTFRIRYTRLPTESECFSSKNIVLGEGNYIVLLRRSNLIHHWTWPQKCSHCFWGLVTSSLSLSACFAPGARETNGSGLGVLYKEGTHFLQPVTFPKQTSLVFVSSERLKSLAQRLWGRSRPLQLGQPDSHPCDFLTRKHYSHPLCGFLSVSPPTLVHSPHCHFSNSSKKTKVQGRIFCHLQASKPLLRLQDKNWDLKHTCWPTVLWAHPTSPVLSPNPPP